MTRIISHTTKKPTSTDMHTAAVKYMEAYRDAQDAINKLEVVKSTIKGWFKDVFFPKAKITEFRHQHLVAQLQSRLIRRYRVTPALAKLLDARKVDAYLLPGIIDQAIAEKKLTTQEITPFATATEQDAFTITTLKDGTL